MAPPTAFFRLRTAMQAVPPSQRSSMAAFTPPRMLPGLASRSALPSASASSCSGGTVSILCLLKERGSFPCGPWSPLHSSLSSIRRHSSFRRLFRSPPAEAPKGKEAAGGEDGRGGSPVSVAAEKEDNGATAVSGEGTEEFHKPQEGRVVPIEFHKEVTDSYISYAVSVLVGRALPDVRDGLKPVHRRILYAMHEMGLSSRKPFRKSARIVGEVLGKFHPHGDSAVYDALVRMAQDFSLRAPLVRGHGNFGSLDADPPAAMRYTECRLEAVSESMLLEDLKHDTVDFVPNFDGSQQEPSVLPARLPTVLLNGSSGIAVAMATNIPPHGLGEVADALCALIHNPNAMIQELMEHLPGPDFPTGGQIVGSFGILEAYRTGRGILTVRGLTQVQQLDKKSNKQAIVISQIPFQTNKAALVKRMADLVDNKILEGVSDIRDESDKSGMRIVVEVKKGANTSVVLNNLYKHTSLQASFGCNMVGILNGKPKLMGLKEILQAFLDFRCSVVERRSRFQLKQAEEKDHVVKGILIALEDIKDVFEIVQHAEQSHSASIILQEKYKLSEVQASAILNMTLRRLTQLERGRFLDEHKALTEEISHLKHLISSRKNILQVIETEILALKRDYATPRRTVLLSDENVALSDLDVVANEVALVTLSRKGYIKRMKLDTFAAQNRGTVGKSSGKLKSDDSLSDFFSCRNHDHLLFFSERGVVLSCRACQIPEHSKMASGTPLVQILSIPPGERITSVKAVSSFANDQYLVMLTAAGYIKRTCLSAFSCIRPQGIVAIQLVAGDELKWVRLAAEGDSVTICSQGGRVMHINCDSQTLPVHRRTSRGMKSMQLKSGDNIAAMDIVPRSVLQTLNAENMNSPWLLFVTEFGCGKRVPLRLFPLRRRNSSGIFGYKFRKGNDRLVALFVVGSEVSDDGETGEEVILGSQGGIGNRLKVRDISVHSRYSGGVILMRLEQGDKVNSVSLVSPSNTENSSPEEAYLSAAEA